jgi:hypothetical protein
LTKSFFLDKAEVNKELDRSGTSDKMAIGKRKVSRERKNQN